MKLFVILSIALFATVNVYGQTSIKKNEMTWNSFNTGIKEAKTSQKKVLIDVYTDWCTWCKKMDATTYTDPKVQKYLKKHFVIIKLNAEGNGTISYAGQTLSPAEFSQGMGVNGYPATLFLNSDGSPITILPGYSEPSMFIHVLSFISEEQYKHKKFSDYLAENGVKQ